MHIIISNSSDKPIYEQIVDNMKDLILNGTLTSGEMLPSIRALAKDLRISVITTKKAYEELEKQDYIEVIPSKGCFVKNKSSELLKEEVLKKIEMNLTSAIHIASQFAIDKEEVAAMFEYLYEEEEHGK